MIDRFDRAGIEGPVEMRLYNTLTRTEEEFSPSQDNLVRMYACGLTVYAEVTSATSGRLSPSMCCGGRCGISRTTRSATS